MIKEVALSENIENFPLFGREIVFTTGSKGVIRGIKKTADIFYYLVIWEGKEYWKTAEDFKLVPVAGIDFETNETLMEKLGKKNRQSIWNKIQYLEAHGEKIDTQYAKIDGKMRAYWSLEDAEKIKNIKYTRKKRV